MLRYLCFILLAGINFSAFAQLQLSAYVFPQSVPAQYILDAKKEYNAFMKNNIAGMNQLQKELFTEEMTYEKVNALKSGDVYLGWNEMEDYLNSILQKITPDSLKNNNLLHVYLLRDGDYNAYSIHDGTLFFTVSLFADLENEAGIAAVLGHELTHYLHQDLRKSYLRRYDLKAKKNRNKDNRKEEKVNAFYNRQEEHSADSIGAILAAKAGYNINYGINNFYTLMRMEDYEKNKGISKQIYINESDLKKKTDSAYSAEVKLFASHPELQERIGSYHAYIKDHNQPDSKSFITGTAEKFKLLQSKTRLETLKILLDGYEYRECAKRAFNYYLFEPDNEAYHYYLLESLRRYFILRPKMVSKSFLTDDYNSSVFKRGEGILHNLHVLIPDSMDYKKIKATALLNPKEPAFETYDDAFNYFADLALEKNYTESLFTIALRNSDSIPVRNEYLKQYLTKPNIRYADYANALLGNKVSDAFSKNNQKLFLFSDIRLLEDHEYGYQRRFMLEEEELPDYYKSLKKELADDYKNRNVILLDELSSTNMQKSNAYKDLITASAIISEAFHDMFMEASAASKETEVSNFFNLNPDYWYLMRDEKINAIETVFAISYIDKTSIKLGSHAYAVYYYNFDPQRATNTFFGNSNFVLRRMGKSDFLNAVTKDLKYADGLK